MADATTVAPAMASGSAMEGPPKDGLPNGAPATNGHVNGAPTAGPPAGGPPSGKAGGPPTGKPGGPPTGPPPFAPPPDALAGMANSIAEAAKAYGSSTSPEEKEAALRRISMTAQKLSQAATHPRDAVFKFGFQPHINASVRIAIGMGLFEALPPSGAGISASSLAEKTGADPELVLRVARALGAFGVLSEVGENEYAHSPMSRPYAQKPPQALFKLEWDIVTHAMSRFPQYFKKYGWKEPSDPTNTPFAFANGVEDVDYFELMYRDAERVSVFADAMENATIQGNMEETRTYPFDSLSSKEDEVVLVDVGGGKGHALMELRKAFPNIKGKMVLQDLKSVLDSGVLVPKDEVEVMPYDILEQKQPVKGAKAYFFKWIFHIWTDEPCRKVLRNHRKAMGPDSRLLICDIVIPDRNPPFRKVALDINMLQAAGKERSKRQFQQLLESEGFKIVKVWGEDNPGNSIVEAVLAEEGNSVA